MSICSEGLLQLTMDTKQFDTDGFRFLSEQKNTTKVMNETTSRDQRSFMLRGGMLALANANRVAKQADISDVTIMAHNRSSNTEVYSVVASDKSLLEEQLGWKIRVDDDQIPLVDTALHLVRDSNILVR
jgi:hypothetical protein